MNIYFSVLIIVMAAFFLFIGIKVITLKKPLFIPSRVFFAFMALACSPQFMFSFVQRIDGGGDIGVISYISPLMYVVLLSFMWVQMQGYMVIGIADDSFRTALHTSLDNNQLKFEEQLSVIRLPDIEAQIQVAIQSWVGTGQLKLRNAKDKTLLPKLVAGVQDYYQKNDVKVNVITAIFYIVVGMIMVGFAFAFWRMFYY